jgi:polysaccharide pyruvyl transferase WcaK-like protein
MKIAVFGFYNSLNAGDDRLQYCITKMLRDIGSIVFLPHNSCPPVSYLKTFDWILIGGGGLVFQRHGIWQNIKKWLEKTNANIGVLGLGINHLPDDLASEVFDLLDRAAFFYVRDRDSKALLNNDSRVEVYPDLSWCFPLSANSEAYSYQNNSIALNLIPCSWKEFDYEQWVTELSKFKIHPFPLCFLPNRDFDLLQKYYGNLKISEFSLEPLLSSQLLVACRYHALIFAMQNRKPFIAINYDFKVQRLLEESDLLDCCLETTEFNKIQAKIEYVLENQEIIISKIDNYYSLQSAKANEMRDKIRNLVMSNNFNLSIDKFSLKQKISQIAKLVTT